MAKRTKRPLNPFQRIAVEMYAGGEFSHFLTADQDTVLKFKGDGLFTFLIRELEETYEGEPGQLTAEDFDGAIRAVQTAIDELQDVLNAIEASKDANCPVTVEELFTSPLTEPEAVSIMATVIRRFHCKACGYVQHAHAQDCDDMTCAKCGACDWTPLAEPKGGN